MLCDTGNRCVSNAMPYIIVIFSQLYTCTGPPGSHCRLVSTSCVSGASIAIGSGKELDMSSTCERSVVLLSLCCFWCTFLGIVAQEDEGEWFGLSM